MHRIGGKYNDAWHYQHMLDPTITSPGSIMPPYNWLFKQAIDENKIVGKINALRKLGVPYKEGYEDNEYGKGIEAINDLRMQAKGIAESLAVDGFETEPEAEIVALIAYLQRLGTAASTKKVVKPSQGACKFALPCCNISPSDGEPKGRPKPRKSRAVSVTTEPLRMNGRKVSVATIALGSTWRNMMVRSPTPSARAART